MGGTETQLAAALRAGAAELTELAVIADQLGGTGRSDVERWQGLDRLSQHLSGIATVLSGMARVVPDLSLDLSDVLAAVTTDRLVDRLVGRASPTEADPGALELFDT